MAITVEAVDFFGHVALRIAGPRAPARTVSLADPTGREELARLLCEIACGRDGEETD